MGCGGPAARTARIKAASGAEAPARSARLAPVRARAAAPRRGVRRPAGRQARRCPRRGCRSSDRRSSSRSSRPRRAQASPAARRSPSVPREAAVLIASLVPALVALRGEELTSYHGAEHVSIGTYETGERPPRSTSAAGPTWSARSLLATASPAAAAELAPARHRNAARLAGSLGAARRRGRGVRLDGPQPRAAARAGARPSRHGAPAAALDERAVATAQLEVAEAALAACLAAEAARRVSVLSAPRRKGPARSGDLRPPRREDARRLLLGRVLQPHARRAPPRRSSSAGRDAGVPAQARDGRWDGRVDRDPRALLARLGWSHRPRAARRRPDRAVGDGDDGRGRLHGVRAPRDRRARHARPPNADRDEHRPRGGGRERKADHLHARATRPPSRADRRRLRRVRRRGCARGPRSA